MRKEILEDGATEKIRGLLDARGGRKVLFTPINEKEKITTTTNF